MNNAVWVPLGLAYSFEENFLFLFRKVHIKHIQIRNTPAISRHFQTLPEPPNIVLKSFHSF